MNMKQVLRKLSKKIIFSWIYLHNQFVVWCLVSNRSDSNRDSMKKEKLNDEQNVQPDCIINSLNKQNNYLQFELRRGKPKGSSTEYFCWTFSSWPVVFKYSTFIKVWPATHLYILSKLVSSLSVVHSCVNIFCWGHWGG